MSFFYHKAGRRFDGLREQVAARCRWRSKQGRQMLRRQTQNSTNIAAIPI